MAASSQPPRFSIIMPAYNEAQNLTQNVVETIRAIESLGLAYEIVLVDDGSHDRTAEIIRQLAKENPQIKAVALPSNQGKGHALRAGFRETRGELIFFLDADLDLDPKQFNVLWEIMQQQAVDIVIGSKRHPQSILHYPWRRRLLSGAYFFLVKWLFSLPIKDTQTGIKLFRREALARIFPKVLVKKYASDLELLVLANHYGYRIAEAPVVVNYRGKFGHIRPKDIFNIWWDTMAVWYRLYWLHYYDRE